MNSAVVPAEVVGAVNAATSAVTGAVNAAANMFMNASNMANVAVNNASKNIPTFNSLLPLGNSQPPVTSSNIINAPKNNTKNTGFSIFGSPTKNTANIKNSSPSPSNFSVPTLNNPWVTPFAIFVGLILLFLALFSVFNTQIKQGYEYVASAFKKSMGLSVQPDVMASTIPIQGEVTVPPVAPQTVTPSEQAVNESIIEKILPSSTNEVFNVAQNKFTYYDAEPLCRALGAELATYEQVKDAWTNGADWCNYGWVKGQMAVYPTQQQTYDKLQAGPVEEHGACGTTGLNGGFFDNPDMRYGVNCYGKKPSQTAHDEEMLMEQGRAPPTPEMLKVDDMISKYRDEADSLYVKPFSDSKWSTA